MPTPEPGTPFTTGGVDDMTAGIEARNDAAEDAAEYDSEIGALTPIQVRKTDANILLAAVSGTWTDVDTTGTAAARTYDLVIPDVTEGQWVRVDLAGFSGASSNGGTALDAVTIVAGAKVNHLSGNTTIGMPQWFLVNAVNVWLAGGCSYQVQAGDIDGGSVRIRLQHKNPSGSATRAISASAASGPLILEGRGPFGQGVAAP